MTVLAGIAAFGTIFVIGTSPIAPIIVGACIAFIAIRDAIKGDN